MLWYLHLCMRNVELPAFTEGQSWMAMAVSERMSWTHGPALPDVSNEQFCSFHQDNLGNGTQTESKLVWSASQCITIYESDKGDNCFLGKSLCLCLKLNALKRCCLKWFAQCIQDKSFHLLFLSGVRPQNISLHSVEFGIALLILCQKEREIFYCTACSIIVQPIAFPFSLPVQLTKNP